MGPRKAAETALSMYIADHRKELQDQKPEASAEDLDEELTSRFQTLTEEALKKLGERADAVNEQRERSRRKRMRKRAKAEAEFRDDGKSHLKELVGEGLLGPDPEEEAPSTPVTGGANPSSTPNNDKSDGQNATSSPSKRAKSITGLAGGPVSSKHLQAIKLATNIDRREIDVDGFTQGAIVACGDAYFRVTPNFSFPKLT